MGVSVLNPVTDGAGYVQFNNTTYTRFTNAVRLKNGAPSALHPHQAPFFFYDHTPLLPFIGTITKVEFLWSVNSASATDGTLGIGFHASPIGDADVDLFTNVRNIDSGEATQVVNTSAKGPFVTDLGAGGITVVEDFLVAEQDIGMGLDLVTGAANWACVLDTYQLRITYPSSDLQNRGVTGRRYNSSGLAPYRKRV